MTLMKTVELTMLLHLEGISERVWLNIGNSNKDAGFDLINNGYDLIFLCKDRRQVSTPIVINRCSNKERFGYEFRGEQLTSSGWNSLSFNELPHSCFLLIRTDRLPTILAFVEDNLEVLEEISHKCTGEFLDNMDDDPEPRTKHWILERVLSGG